MSSDRRRSNFLAALLGALLVALPMAGLALGGALDSDDANTVTVVPAPDTSSSASAGETVAPAAPARSATDVSALYERVSPGVVSVEVRTPGGGATGSGFVLNRDGYLLTNDHVVEDAENVRVRFPEGGPVAAKVVGTDESTDLALLKIDPSAHKLTPLALGSSSALKVGQSAIAIGSPYRLQGTLTTGVVSALRRSITAPNNFPIDNVIQTDAAINPGNSGGPLLDASGRVVGVNAQIATNTGANDGVGFAIPIDTAKDVVPQLQSGKQIKRPYLGVSTSDPVTGTGALVERVITGGPAADGGLREGDRIVAIGGRKVAASDDVAGAVVAHKPGEKVVVKVRRDGSDRTLTVTLGTRPDVANPG
jgi:putative serine protease PepD